MSPSVTEALGSATRRLARAGVASPRRDARLLLGALFPGGMSALIAAPERVLTAAEESSFAVLINRRATREPLSHLLGRREFWSLEFEVSSAALDPRPDSETLIEAVLGEIADRAAPWRVLDLGTGTGCLLLALLSELPHASGVGIDASPAALDLAARNAARLGFGGRARFRTLDWRAGNFFAEVAAPFEPAPFDIVMANPPYIPSAEIAALAPEVACFEPRAALDGGADGLDGYRALGPLLPRLVAGDGIVAFEVGAAQAASVATIVGAAAPEFGVARRKADLGGIERSLLWRRSSLGAADKKTVGNTKSSD